MKISLQAERSQPDVAKRDAALVELQADPPAPQRCRVGVVEHLLAVEIHQDLAGLDLHFKRLPRGPVEILLDRLSLHQTSRGKRVVRSGNIQLVTVGGDVAGIELGGEKDPAVRAGLAQEFDVQHVIGERSGRHQQPGVSLLHHDRTVLDAPVRLTCLLPSEKRLAIEQRDPTFVQQLVAQEAATRVGGHLVGEGTAVSTKCPLFGGESACGETLVPQPRATAQPMASTQISRLLKILVPARRGSQDQGQEEVPERYCVGRVPRCRATSAADSA